MCFLTSYTAFTIGTRIRLLVVGVEHGFETPTGVSRGQGDNCNAAHSNQKEESLVESRVDHIMREDSHFIEYNKVSLVSHDRVRPSVSKLGNTIYTSCVDTNEGECHADEEILE